MVNLKKALLTGITALTMGLSLISKIRAQDNQTLVATSEISYDCGKLELRLKPSYNLRNHKGTTNLEFMLGKSFRDNNSTWRLYGDFKTDLEDNSWAGIRGEYDYKVERTGTHLGIQLRHFFGLNGDSEDHFYYIPYIMQDLGKKFKIGVWDYAKQNYENSKGFSFVGPFLVYSPSDNIGLLIHYGVDTKNEGDLIYLKMNLRFGK